MSTFSAPALRRHVHDALSRVWIGAPETLDLLLTALVAPGHVLLEGVPGVAKTTLARAFTATLGGDFRRIQFTPDMLPADITGAYILNQRDQAFVLRRGPVFAHVVLGDEINRAPAKTQSALLEAMQEQQVTIEGDTLPLPDPFLVLATQNPLEQEGVYPLPEAQVDRFLLKIEIGYPSTADERRILDTYDQPVPSVPRVLDPASILALRAAAARLHVAPEIKDFIVSLVTATREHPRVRLGASPRAGLGLMRAAKAMAFWAGRDFVLPDDVRGLASPVLAHRLLITPEAELDGLSGQDVIAEVLRAVPFRGPGSR
jgi:MoxR-like ATPase